MTELLQELSFKSKPNVWAYFSVKVHFFFTYPAATAVVDLIALWMLGMACHEMCSPKSVN